jgi:hypothetical protein
MRPYCGRFDNPNESETGVNLRQHEIYTDTMGEAIMWRRIGEPKLGENGYRRRRAPAALGGLRRKCGTERADEL